MSTSNQAGNKAVRITVRVEGRCGNNHLVSHNLIINVPSGSRGFADATTDCPTCKSKVDMVGSFTTPA
ncbi:hypothetical protein [Actinokineospora diospyrosa]|uniref:Uncharacterized protein n=1 Tax=Actinokineospora diospyrosa TaxID=103728 RepID=A0ABT1I6B9_9PSEU|nr:hypothetical protein [Actinokineospora diospyrosa]MCP2268180.1 hypothetical protein [Actinokineospora diospyrosa]